MKFKNQFLQFSILILIIARINVICGATPIKSKKKLNKALQIYLSTAEKNFSKISSERKLELDKIALYIQSSIKTEGAAQLTYICTHNSRRSHFGQVWAAAAAVYYEIPNVKTFSGGTEATAFNERAVAACKRAGFEIKKTSDDKNSVYKVYYAQNANPINAFSKKYDHISNPQNNFCAIMTCSQADQACPIVKGANKRVAIPYEDPKAFDGTPEETAKYDERCKQIATETLYVFSKVKN